MLKNPSNDRQAFHMTQTHSLIQNPSKKGKPTARARKRLADAPPLEFHITNLAHDGRGVAVYEADNATHNPDKDFFACFIRIVGGSL